MTDVVTAEVWFSRIHFAMPKSITLTVNNASLRRDHHLERALVAGAELFGDVDRSHPAALEQSDDAELPREHGPGGERRLRNVHALPIVVQNDYSRPVPGAPARRRYEPLPVPRA